MNGGKSRYLRLVDTVWSLRAVAGGEETGTGGAERVAREVSG
jgi:hypothetical protein